MLTITLATVKAAIKQRMKGTSLSQINDFYDVAFHAANRLSSRIDPDETRRIATLASPFFDDVNSYVIAGDYKRMIDIRPQANRQSMPGNSHWEQTAPRQFEERLSPDSFSIRWNNFVRTIRAQRLPAGNVAKMDSFDSTTSNGLWTAEGDASGLYVENLNFVEGAAALGMNLSGVGTTADIVNSTAAVTDMSLLRYNDSSFLYFWIPVGFSARFTSFTLRRGSSAANYKQATATTKADGTVFTDGWNMLRFDWITSANTGTVDDTKNTYRRFGINYTAGTAIPGCLIDAWTDSLGTLYEMEYYSEYMFRDSTGTWISKPTDDSDLVNVGPNSYEIFLTEMMIDITQNIRTGNTRAMELNDLRLMLNGQPQSRYVKDPPYHGLYADYLSKYPSSSIVTVTRTYDFDV